VEVEDLHLLGRLHAGAGLAQVLQLAPLRGPLEIEGVAQGVEVGLADERRHQGHGQQQDQPGRVHQQAHAEADHGDGVLDLAEQLAHQVHPAHGLAPGAVQPVLQVRILEVLQVQGGGVLHQAHAAGIGEQFREQAVGVADHPAQQVRAHRHRQLQRQQGQQRPELARAQRVAEPVQAQPQPGQPHHLVDDQLADVEHQHRQHGADQAQAEAGQGQAGAGGPDLAQERRDVAHGVETLAQSGVAAFPLGLAGCGVGHGKHCAVPGAGRPSPAGNGGGPLARASGVARGGRLSTRRAGRAAATGARRSTRPGRRCPGRSGRRPAGS